MLQDKAITIKDHFIVRSDSYPTGIFSPIANTQTLIRKGHIKLQT
jgi:hypothetical protein